jgi:hypothetical protein
MEKRNDHPPSIRRFCCHCGAEVPPHEQGTRMVSSGWALFACADVVSCRRRIREDAQAASLSVDGER